VVLLYGEKIKEYTKRKKKEKGPYDDLYDDSY
jgi:hypothetical protein